MMSEISPTGDLADQKAPEQADKVAFAEGDVHEATQKKGGIKPPRAQEHLEHAQYLMEVARPGIVADQVFGLVRGEVPAQYGEALSELRAAMELAPRSPLLRLKLGQLLVGIGAASDGITYLEEAAAKKQRSPWFRVLGAAYASHRLQDFERSLWAYERAFQTDPQDTKNAAAVADTGPKGTLDWHRVWRVAAQLEAAKKSSLYRRPKPRELMDQLFGPSADHRTVNALRAEIESSADSGKLLHPSVVQLIALRVQFLGYLTSGFRLLEGLAHRRVARMSKSAVQDANQLQQAMSALVYVEDYGQALTLSDPLLQDEDHDEKTKRGYQKLHADVRLHVGDVSALRAYADKHSEADLPLEAAFASLTKNSSVAVLGGELSVSKEAELDQYDLVVHIGEPPKELLPQVDIVYLTGPALWQAAGRLESAVERGELKFVVGSCADYNPLDRHAWLRIPQHEYGLSFRGWPTALQRALYDLLRFEPKSIHVTGTDLYITQFAEAARSPFPVLPGTVVHSAMVHHDLNATFKFLKALYKADLFVADDSLASVLALETDAYLKELSEQQAFEKKQCKNLEVPNVQAQLLLDEARDLLRIEKTEVVPDPILGLTKGKSRAHEKEALKKIDGALGIIPGDPVLLYEKGTLLFEKGDTEEGLSYIEAAVTKRPNSDWYSVLGAAYRRPHVAQFGRALSAYERAFQRDPKDRKSLAGILNIGARGTMDWPRLWKNARRLELSNELSPYNDPEFRDRLDRVFSREASTEHVYSALRALDEMAIQERHLSRSVAGFVATRLQFMGYLAAGYDLRADIARKYTSASATDVDSLRKLVKAIVYLGDYEHAVALSNPYFWPSEDLANQRKHLKIHAESQLLLGNPVPYIEYSNSARGAVPLPGDMAMEDMVKGKRVAIVGPVDSGDGLGRVIDEFDVIVRPRFAPDFVARHADAMGSRTDVVYINGQDIRGDIPVMAEAVRQGSLQLAVARPLSYKQHHRQNLPWLRFYRQDFGLHFHGFALGMQRFAYDILQFAPAEIGIFNSDMYTSSSAFAEGYRPDKDQKLGPGSIMNDLIVNHDLKFDFKYMQSLKETGIIKGYGIVDELLSMAPEEYVEAVESKGSLR